MKILNLLSRLVLRRKSKSLEAKLIGKWRYVNTLSRVSTDGGEELITHYNNQNKVSIEFVEGNFVLVEDQLTYDSQVFKVEFHHDTLVLSHAQSEETYIRWEE
ncbi:hypothetical protein [Sphingobacterium corticibacter]|uniref:Lipocalin-like domain-containing protein n=1 Tax=Sphingobacterium corticibacter TaxID=2171749 RepID=A0A2T8HGQ0_9SPHI|nr:hypothetical protein [Sphingobacterium corticibacter]PVH24626.1 hypothetical protein DC487_13935 [Sphingobacterium corticibacter]